MPCLVPLEVLLIAVCVCVCVMSMCVCVCVFNTHTHNYDRFIHEGTHKDKRIASEKGIIIIRKNT